MLNVQPIDGTKVCSVIQLLRILISWWLMNPLMEPTVKPHVLAVLLLAISLPTVAETRYTGKIEGSAFIVDVPAEPSGDVLFLARGYRPDTLPLSAAYEKDTAFFQTLLGSGWTIASPSFQGNRWIMVDGVADLVALRSHIDEQILPVDRAFLYGESMGGGIVTLLAEQSPDGFSGALSIGAYLYEEPKGETPEQPVIASYLNGQPRIPIMFLTNNVENEVAGSREYIEHAQAAALTPALKTVERPGHVNINSAERLAAFNTLVNWSETRITPASGDGTILMDPDSTSAIQDGYAAGQITRTRPLYGNIYTSFVMADLDAIGVKINQQLNVTHESRTVTVTFATTYSDVPLGEWVAFIDPEGYVQLSRNYANATATLKATSGDPLLISSKE